MDLNGFSGHQPGHVGYIGFAYRVLNHEHVIGPPTQFFGRGLPSGVGRYTSRTDKSKPGKLPDYSLLQHQHAEQDVFVLNDQHARASGILEVRALYANLGIVQSCIVKQHQNAPRAKIPVLMRSSFIIWNI